jgi:hypothetical protein
MKQGGVNCNDCHLSSSKIVKPDLKICVKCHEAGYDKTGEDWKSDIKKASGTLNDMLSKINKQSENESEVIEARNLLKRINMYPSLYAHNYELISTLISEKKKALEKYAK